MIHLRIIFLVDPGLLYFDWRAEGKGEEEAIARTDENDSAVFCKAALIFLDVIGNTRS